MNRPLVVTPLGTKLCRPSETVLKLLPVGTVPAFTKEDGEEVRDSGHRRHRVQQLCLLTAGAAGYFGRRGFGEKDRATAPPSMARGR